MLRYVVAIGGLLCAAIIIAKGEVVQTPEQCDAGTALPKRYLLYEVNPSEGFNLRRDVYMRVASLVRNLQERGDWSLILPPWGDLYHWKSKNITQVKLPWSLFFDVPSMRKYVPVVELADVLKEHKKIEIEKLYYLQHYAEGWSDGTWEEKFDERPCIDNPPYIEEDNEISGWFWGYENVSAKKLVCLSVQGHAKTLMELLLNSRGTFVMIDRAEIVLHDTFGDREYWKVRRSMRFSKELVKLASEFRLSYLNSSNEMDGTIQPDDWRDEKERVTKGGPYLCVHLRRRDFLYGRAKHVPSLTGAAQQIVAVLKNLDVNHVFLATDAPTNEIAELKKLVDNTVTYDAPATVHNKYKDGGVAIIDQIICSHARYFVGTFESTFSFRIQEEREILGFSSKTTFNRLCGDDEPKCQQPTKWKVVF